MDRCALRQPQSECWLKAHAPHVQPLLAHVVGHASVLRACACMGVGKVTVQMTSLAATATIFQGYPNIFRASDSASALWAAEQVRVLTASAMCVSRD